MKNIGLLLLRVFAGGLMLTHGYDKFMGYNTMVAVFPDPIGLGSSFSLQLAIFSELFCAVLLILGVLTRLSLIPLMITMLVAAFVVHGADPFAKKELALLYLGCYASLFLTGPGEFVLSKYVPIPIPSFNWLMK
jgi:putative oxidoreductase